MKNVDDIETWRLVVEHWRAQDKDLRHLQVPPELAPQLGVPLELTVERRTETTSDEDFDNEEPMAKKNTKKKGGKSTKKATAPKTVSDPTPVSTAPNEQPQPQAQVTGGEHESIAPQNKNEPKWKKRSHFDGEDCGYSGCTRKADGYVPGIRATKEGERDKRTLWFGPACVKCIRLYSDSLMPLSLAQLAQQRLGASDLAGVLDLEVGEVLKRLAAAGIDERGNPLNGAPQPQQIPPAIQEGIANGTVFSPQAPTAFPIVAKEETYSIAVVVPYDVLEATRQEMVQSGAALAQFFIRSQQQMDYASGYMQRVKGLWKTLDDSRKDMGRPFRAVVEQIQTNFKPVLEALEAVETVIKQKIDEGMAWSTQQAQAGFQAAHAALAAGDPQGVAVATQQAVGADLALSKGVSMRPKVKFEIVNPGELPPQYWSPDEDKVQAALDGMDPAQLQSVLAAGYTPIAGCRVWFENTIASRSAA